MILPRLLKRNRFGFRLRRRSVSNRFFQLLVVIIVLFLFIYFLLYALRFVVRSVMSIAFGWLLFDCSLNDEIVPPDYTWLKTRNMSAFVRPLDHDTTILEPSPNPCPPEDKLRLVVMVTSSPENPERRSVIRKTWAKELLTFPGVRVFFNLGTSSAPYVQVLVNLIVVIINTFLSDPSIFRSGLFKSIVITMISFNKTLLTTTWISLSRYDSSRARKWLKASLMSFSDYHDVKVVGLQRLPKLKVCFKGTKEVDVKML